MIITIINIAIAIVIALIGTLTFALSREQMEQNMTINPKNRNERGGI